MIIYGSEITSDILFPLALPLDTTSARYNIKLSSDVPARHKSAITCGFPFYQAHGREVYLYSDRAFEGCEKVQPWCYEVKDVVSFFWKSGERIIYYELAEQGDAHLLSFWFVHLLLPLFFTLEGMYDFLHAGAVEIAGKPILFIAPSMGGKSTLTDYFIRQGHVLVSDDKIATFIENKKFMAVGSHPYHRPYRKFEELGIRIDRFSADFKPIHAFYTLNRMKPDAEVVVEEVKGFKKFDALLPNYLYMFSYLKPQRLKYLSEMLNRIKVFSVAVPWDLGRLNEVHETICDHCNRL